MDIFAHALWVGAGATILRRKSKISNRTVWIAIALSILPDILLFIPVFFWALSPFGVFKSFYNFIFAMPGLEPDIPASVVFFSHHLHCIMHSAVVAGAVTVIGWACLNSFPIAILGWWVHILIDIFTHSDEYYAVPVLYPFTERAFNGIAWINPSFQGVNYLLLAGVYFWIYSSRKRIVL